MAVDTLTIEERPQQEVVVQPQVRDRVIIWYHESDLELVQVLDPHLQLLMLRLGKQFQLHFFGSPQHSPKAPTVLSEEDKKYPSSVRIYERQKAEYEEAQREQQSRYKNVVNALEQRCALFVPCVSNACMLQLWKDTERDARLAAIFAQPAFEIMPVPMRPTNTGEANASEPVSAHDGYQREMACKEYAVTLENLLRANPHYKPASSQSPLATLLLAEPQRASVKEQKKHWWSFLR